MQFLKFNFYSYLCVGGDLEVPQIDLLPLSAQYLSKNQVFLMDIGWTLYLYLSVHAPQTFIQDVLGESNIFQI